MIWRKQSPNRRSTCADHGLSRGFTPFGCCSRGSRAVQIVLLRTSAGPGLSRNHGSPSVTARTRHRDSPCEPCELGKVCQCEQLATIGSPIIVLAKRAEYTGNDSACFLKLGVRLAGT